MSQSIATKTLPELLALWDSGDEGPVVGRIATRVAVSPTGCWECSYAKDSSGYPQISVRARMLLVHRVTYIAAKGSIPSGLQIDHLCRNRACHNIRNRARKERQRSAA